VVNLGSRTARAIVTGFALIAYLGGCASQAVREGTGAGPQNSTSAGPTAFDVGRDFSFAANPHGPWSYGYTRGTRLAGSEFMLSTLADPTTPVGFWHPGPGSEGYYPYVAASPDGTTDHDATNSWEVRPGELALEASATGQFAVIRFNVPGTGTFDIAADFAGIHKGLSTTDVHVLLNDESLFTAEISGYGGDPAFYQRQGPNPTASFRGTRALRAGDVLIFAVGYGANHTHFGDTTGLIATVLERA